MPGDGTRLENESYLHSYLFTMALLMKAQCRPELDRIGHCLYSTRNWNLVCSTLLSETFSVH